MAECSRGGKRMKKIVILFFVVLASLATYAQDNLQFPIEPTMAKEWKYLSDQVMGGVSEGGTTLVQDGDLYYLRLTGDVSTRNNGGFVQFRSKISLFNKPEMFQLIQKADKDGEGLEGVRLNVRGNGETYPPVPNSSFGVLKLIEESIGVLHQTSVIKLSTGGGGT